MSASKKIVCRLHPATGRLSCSWSLTSNPRRPSGSASEPTAEAGLRSHHEAVRRARRRVVELVHDYDLRHLWTLTFADEPDGYKQVAAAMTQFSRRCRASGIVMPRLAVPERSGSGRWHVHVAVAEYIPSGLMRRAWTAGFVYPPDLLEVEGPAALDKISAYLTKSFDTTPKGSRRYATSAGLRPKTERFTAPDAVRAVEVATELLGRDPLRTAWYAGTLMAFYPAAPAPGDAP